jgi:hypothetical protein
MIASEMPSTIQNGIPGDHHRSLAARVFKDSDPATPQPGDCGRRLKYAVEGPKPRLRFLKCMRVRRIGKLRTESLHPSNLQRYGGDTPMKLLFW